MLSGCSSYYKNLRSVEVNSSCSDKIKPRGIESTWYHAGVDVIGKHMSGLLLIKQMPDHSNRIVFTNEAGLTFFDFAYAPDGSFEVKSILVQLDKAPVVETLQKDFELLLGLPFKNKLKEWHNGKERYFGVLRDSEIIYFTTTQDCSALGRLEIGSKRKRKVSITRQGTDSLSPEIITISHFTFDMTINLKRINQNVN
jgi:hypothetical protein